MSQRDQHEAPQLREPAGIACGADLLEQANDAELRVRRQARFDDGGGVGWHSCSAGSRHIAILSTSDE
jgi:hypothetical protein